MSLNRSEMTLAVHAGDKTTVAKAELCSDRQLSVLAGELNERPEESRNIRRRKLIGPFLIAAGLEFALFDDAIDKETSNAINQQRDDAQLSNDRRATKRSNGRFAQDGKVFFKRTIRSFRRRAQSKQLAKAFGASWDFQNKPRMLSNRNVSGIA